MGYVIGIKFTVLNNSCLIFRKYICRNIFYSVLEYKWTNAWSLAVNILKETIYMEKEKLTMDRE